MSKTYKPINRPVEAMLVTQDNVSEVIRWLNINGIGAQMNLYYTYKDHEDVYRNVPLTEDNAIPFVSINIFENRNGKSVNTYTYSDDKNCYIVLETSGNRQGKIKTMSLDDFHNTYQPNE